LEHEKLPMVYACSGCSNSGQMANVFANRLDRAEWAEMGCLAGVAGNVPEVMVEILKAIESERPVWVIDGCHHRCGLACLKQRDIVVEKAVVLTNYGHIKRRHADVSPVEADRIFMNNLLPDLGIDET
jgi:uncharacterized metal-binding protein